MDLVDIIVEKRFLGQEFLTWLWWKSEERGGSVLVPGRGDATVVFEKHMLLEYGEGDTCEKLICQGLQSELKEARTGLRLAKKLEQARIHLTMGSYEWNFTLVASMMEFRNVKLPKTGKIESGSLEKSDEVEGLVLERIHLFEQLVQVINDLFRDFCILRTSEKWKEELRNLQGWIHMEKG